MVWVEIKCLLLIWSRCIYYNSLQLQVKYLDSSKSSRTSKMSSSFHTKHFRPLWPGTSLKAPPEVVCILNIFSGHVDSFGNSLWGCCWRTVLTDGITWVFTCQTKAGKRRLYFLSTSLPHSHSCASDFPNFSSSPLVSSPYVALCIRWPSATTPGSGQTELLRNVPLFNGWPSGPQHGSTSPSLTARGLSFWRREGVEGSFQTNFPI